MSDPVTPESMGHIPQMDPPRCMVCGLDLLTWRFTHLPCCPEVAQFVKECRESCGDPVAQWRDGRWVSERLLELQIQLAGRVQGFTRTQMAAKVTALGRRMDELAAHYRENMDALIRQRDRVLTSYREGDWSS